MGINNRKDGFEVAPLSIKQIQMASDATREFAKQLGFVNEDGRIDIVRLLELGNLDVACVDKNSQLELSVVPDELLPKAEAKTYPNGVIEIRESVYNSATSNDPRSRFTLAHELFHALAHCSQITYCRNTSSNTKIYCNSEWQADTFAGNLLLPDELIERYKALDEQTLSSMLGVSVACIKVRKKKYYSN